MTDREPELDLEHFPAPAEGILMINFIVVARWPSDRGRAYNWDIGGEVRQEAA